MRRYLRQSALRKWVLVLYGCAIVSSIAAAVVTPGLRAPLRKAQAKARFIERWTEAFSKCKTREEMAALAKREPHSFFGVGELGESEWIAGIVHDFHSGDPEDEWDAAVLRDSRGRITSTDDHICGEGAFEVELASQAYHILSDFYKRPPWTLTPDPHYEVVPVQDNR